MSYEDIVNLALRRGIFFPSSEIYQSAPAGFYDFGPYGVAIRRKIIEEWRRMFVQREGALEIGVEADFNEEGEIASAALAAFTEEYGEPPWAFFQAAVRDAVYLVADAIEENGYDADKIKDALYATKDWEGAIGKLTFDENGDPILSFRAMKIVEGEVIPN